MEADFSGYATKAGLRCSDGRTIEPNAFQRQHQATVPLVWQHGHSDPQNVLGHCILENRADGVYAYGYFNKSQQALHARELLEHGDINMMSIWANQLIEKSKRVLHGAIREVSLVLSGANPGAVIESVNIRHDDGSIDEDLEDEALIFTGLELEHSSPSGTIVETDEEKTAREAEEARVAQEEAVAKAAKDAADAEAAKGTTEETKEVQHEAGDDENETIGDIYDSMNEKQKTVLQLMVGEAVAAAKEDAQHDALHEGGNNNDDTKGETVKHNNVFESGSETTTDVKERHVLSHNDMKEIVEEAKKSGNTLKSAVTDYALAHGIDDIDTLFPDAQALNAVPEWLRRRNEWVDEFFGAARKTPFSRIKSVFADLTEAEARAKGYIKGAIKKEQFFRVSKRTTTPTTVYKKQKLDRDDIVDITDFDVVAWLKVEMRFMLEEEIARAGLLGDGREAGDEDKIDEEKIRPIISDDELFVHTIRVNLGDANSSINELIDAVVGARSQYRGTGLPTMFTTETVIGRFMLLRDTLGRRIYKSLDEVATELRVKKIVPVEVMEEYDDVLAVFVNPVDYVYGATRGGEVTMFEDFDIDYNQHKYLIETRCCGALTKWKSAIVVRSTAAGDVVAVPAAPTFDGTDVTIVDTAGVVYRNADTNAVLTAAGGPYAVAEGTTLSVHAEPAAGRYIANSDQDDWNFTNNG